MSSATGIGEIFDFAGKLIDRIFPDKQQSAEAHARLEALKQSGELAILSAAQKQDEGQAQVNAAEAGNASLFVSGWRPAIGWICATIILYAYLLRPALAWYMAIHYPEVKAPEFPMDYIWEMLFGMLGIGGLRTFEKLRGVTR